MTIIPIEWRHSNYYIIENSQNAEKSPGDLRWLVVIQNSVKDHLLTLMWKKRICKIVDLTVPADHRIKLKESKKKDEYFDVARESKKLRNTKVTSVAMVVDVLGTMTKGLLKGLDDLEDRGRVETTQTTALLSTARILRRVLGTWGDVLSHKLQWKTISQYWCEKH